MYYLPDLDVIPDEAYLPLADFIAWKCAPCFGQQADQALLTLGVQAAKDLETMQANDPSYEALEIQAY